MDLSKFMVINSIIFDKFNAYFCRTYAGQEIGLLLQGQVWLNQSSNRSIPQTSPYINTSPVQPYKKFTPRL
jgi:hypothetical protein